MKRLLFIIISIAMLLNLSAQNRRIVLPVLITHQESDKIAQKSVDIELKNIKFNNKEPQLASEITQKLAAIDSIDAEHYVFVMGLNPGDGDEHVHIVVWDQDIIDGDAALKQSYWGNLQIGRAQFVVTQNQFNKEILNRLFTNARGKTTFERVWEYIEDDMERPTPHATALDAMWNGSELNVKRFIIDEEDQLKQDEQEVVEQESDSTNP